MSRQFRGFGISFSTNPHADVDLNGLEDLAIGKINNFFMLLVCKYKDIPFSV